MRDEEGSGNLGLFLALLDGTRTEKEIAQSLPRDKRAAFSEFVHHFLDQQYLELPTSYGREAPVEDPAKWEGVLTSLSLSTRDNVGAFNRLRRATILVLGAGRLGAAVAQGLARLGAGAIRVWDPARVTPEEERELAYGAGSAGRPRAEVLCERLGAAARDTRFEAVAADFDGLDAVLAGNTLVVVAYDRASPSLFEKVNARALEDRFHWVLAYTDGYDGHVGPHFIPFETSCYTCMQLRLRGSVSDLQRHQSYLDHVRAADGARLPVLFGAAETVAGMLLAEIPILVEFSCGSLSGVAAVLDMQTLSMEVENVFRLPRCPSCGKLARRQPMQQTHATITNVMQLAAERSILKPKAG